MSSLEGFIQVISSIIPANWNPKLWTVRNYDVKGANQNFVDLNELVGFHPNKMQRGMRASVNNFPSVGKSTDFKLMVDPALLLNLDETSKVTVQNYMEFWQEIETTTPVSIRVYNYAPDGPGGGAPLYPYTLAEESKWLPEFDAQKNHRWMRFRDDDVDSNADTIFDNWSVPISLNSFQSGDYVENRFQRYNLSKPDQNLTSVGSLEDGRHYVIVSGSVLINNIPFEAGRRFTFNLTSTFVFQTATVNETNIAPPRVDGSGQPNNEPVGWEDTPPIGIAMLWMITGQKSIYGQLKSEWVIRRIDEKPNYVRYSYAAEPNPNTLCSSTESAADGMAADIALNAAGWIKTFTDQTFMAYREDTGTPGVYTAWQLEKISEESGEYIDRVFKLYPINADPDSAEVQPPTTRTPSNEGWADAPLVETVTTINFVSEARKFFDGTLKTMWSKPVPYTGQSTYQDLIVSTPGDEFKTDPNVTPAVTVPAEITLAFHLYKGVDKVWEASGVTMTFQWFKVYDDGAIVNPEEEATAGASDFQYLAASGTPGTEGFLFANQRVKITPNAVNGNAVFRCVATLQTAGDPIIFEEEISILDITDGKDAKNLSVTADNQLVIYDTVGAVFVPLNIVLRAYYSNIGSPTLYWFKWNGSNWGTPILSGSNTYSSLSSTHFNGNTNAQEARFAVSNHPTNPGLADNIVWFTDTITIGKSSSAGVGAPGENSVIALLDNESHTVVVNSTTNVPYTGEIGSTGKAITKIEMWNGTTKLSIGTGGTDAIMAISSDNPDITFQQRFGTQGSDAQKYAEIYVNTWAAGAISAVCTVTLTYATKVYTKKFSISSTKDAPGAIILDMDCSTGFEWTPANRSNKTVVGNLYDNNVVQTSGYQYRWLLNGAASLGSRSNWIDTNRTMVIARNEVGSSATITCEVRQNGQTAALRSRSVVFTDVLDNKKYIAWTNSTTVNNSHKIPDNTTPSTVEAGLTVNGVTWRLSDNVFWQSNNAEYQSIGEELTTGWVWTTPQDIRGEKGDQGPNGDYFFNLYKANGTTLPSSNASITTMRDANGWSRLPPTTGVVYFTTGRFNGTSDPIDGGSGYPPNAAIPELGWSVPVKITGVDGTDGTDGNAGTSGVNGWSPIFAAVADGATREVLQLVDWVGGSGTKPSISNPTYIGTTGFVGVIGSAVNIKGAQGNGVKVQVGGSTWTQGTPVNGDLWIDKA